VIHILEMVRLWQKIRCVHECRHVTFAGNGATVAEDTLCTRVLACDFTGNGETVAEDTLCTRVSACDVYLVFIVKLILVYTKFEDFFFSVPLRKGTSKISTWTSLVKLVWKCMWNKWCNSDSWLTMYTIYRVDISLTIVGHVWVDTVHVAFCCIVTVFSSNICAWF
jgi:hypothetical protein